MEIKYIAAIVQFTMEELIELAKEAARQELGLASTENIEIEIKDSARTDLWYPDDSGDWVEVNPMSSSMPPELNFEDAIRFMYHRERRDKKYHEGDVFLASQVNWTADDGNSKIVAYRKY